MSRPYFSLLQTAKKLTMKFKLWKERPSYANAPRREVSFGLLMIMSKFMGLLPIWESPNRLLRAVNYVYYSIINLLFAHIIVLGFYDIYVNWDGQVTHAAYTTINIVPYVCAIISLIYYQYWNEDLRKLIQILQSYRFRAARGISVANMEASLGLATKVSNISSAATIIAVCTWIFEALIVSYLTKSRRLPLILAYPIELQKSPNYEIAFILQTCCFLYVGTFYSTISGLYLTFTILMRGQFVILCSNLRNVCHTGALRAGVSYRRLTELDPSLQHDQHAEDGVEVVDCVYDCRNGEDITLSEINDLNVNCEELQYSGETGVDFIPFEKEIMEAIQDCVEHHKALRNFCELQQSFFRFPLSVEILILVLEITVSFYSIVESFEVKIMQYTLVASMHLFIFCMCGRIIYSHSSAMHDAVWEASWWGAGQKVTKTLTLIMHQGMRPYQLTAGPFFDLSLANFISAVKLSFSLYTLLQESKS